ncbi:hypothetical protein SSPO_023680 [Streptomyces antimycoticus]|uniref:DUF624 domain-containing protein n=1 Tax=Streptomyces antimycoticus TaxID=68175 RepID=A0A499UHJ2_9ACTN|nr:DUF624 domain-containing protein [Streptomyces antimycoticus]BBJ39650.1 hypothetical protein SSPO_023680 [Streptomyces antimycoticus]
MGQAAGVARGEAAVRRTARRPARGTLRFALFAECLLTGVWMVLVALPVITLLPAFAAGCAHLRRHLDGERSTWRDFLTGLREATRSGWRFSLLWWAALALLAFDLRVARTGALPGGPALIAVSVAGLLAVLVLGLRTATVRRPGTAWPAAARTALRQGLAADPGGSLLLIGGLAVLSVAAWQMLPLIAPAAGALAGCAVAVERRARG